MADFWSKNVRSFRLEMDESTKNNEFLDKQKKIQILKREIKLGFCFVFVIAAFTYDWVRLIKALNPAQISKA